MRLLARLLLPVLLIATATPAAEAAGPRWRAWDAGLAEASRTHKPVLVDVFTGWCGWCKRMDRDVYARTDVQALLEKHFVPVRIDAEASTPASYEGKRYTLRTLAGQRFGVDGYPTTMFLRENGHHLVNLPGYVPAERFKLVLRYVGEGHMERGVKFDAFEKGARAKP